MRCELYWAALLLRLCHRMLQPWCPLLGLVQQQSLHSHAHISPDDDGGKGVPVPGAFHSPQLLSHPLQSKQVVLLAGVVVLLRGLVGALVALAAAGLEEQAVWWNWSGLLEHS